MITSNLYNSTLKLQIISSKSHCTITPLINSLGTNLISININNPFTTIKSFSIASKKQIDYCENSSNNSIDIQFLDSGLSIGQNSIQFNVISLSEKYTYSTKNTFQVNNFTSITIPKKATLIDNDRILIEFNNPVLLTKPLCNISIYGVELPIKKIERYNNSYNCLTFHIGHYKNSIFANKPVPIFISSTLDGCGSNTHEKEIILT